MRPLLIIIFFSNILLTYGQDTLFLDVNWDEVQFENQAKYIKILERSSNNQDSVSEKVFFKNGKLKSIKSYSSYKEQMLQGENREWYNSGQIRKILNYNNDKLDGEVITYFENGQKKRHDYFEVGKFIKGTCWASSGKETTHFDYMVMPEFPGGTNQLVRYIASNTRYPYKSKLKGVQGVVIVNFNIDKNGNVTNITIREGVSKKLDKEAIRVVKKMPKWEPGMEDGDLISVNFNLPFSFKLFKN